MRPLICMVTDRRRLGTADDGALIRRIALVARAGVHLIQIRERDLPDRALCRLVADAVAAVKGTQARVLVNDRLDVAIAADAHGVHLRADSAPSHRVRAAAREGLLIGRSIHSSDEAAREAGDGAADYLIFGTVFDTPGKPDGRVAGLTALAGAVAAARTLPLLAIGGVTVETVGSLPRTGCVGFAGIRQFAEASEDRLPDVIKQAVGTWQNSER